MSNMNPLNGSVPLVISMKCTLSVAQTGNWISKWGKMIFQENYLVGGALNTIFPFLDARGVAEVMGYVSHLRCLAPWAFVTQRLRVGLTSGAPPALGIALLLEKYPII